jgi:hypothetical protein
MTNALASSLLFGHDEYYGTGIGIIRAYRTKPGTVQC